MEECIVSDLLSQVGQGRAHTQCGLGIGLSLVRGLVIMQPWLALLSADLRAAQRRGDVKDRTEADRRRLFGHHELCA